jgi:UDP-N-acetylglucosamine diphosphorylase/glucosamine-1-phosphate N-acetyltransferase
MNYILFDSSTSVQLYPVTQTRSVAHLLCGIWTMKERWDFYLNTTTHILTTPVLQPLYLSTVNSNEATVYINAAYFGSTSLVATIAQLEDDQQLTDTENNTIAWRTATPVATLAELYSAINTTNNRLVYKDDALVIDHLWDIFVHNDAAIRSDFESIKKNNENKKIPAYVTLVGDENNIFISPDAVVGPCIMNATAGPIYIGAGAEVMEGCIIRGPFALKSHGVLKMGAKVYGATTIGEGSKVGGEVNNIVMFNNSNKGHDGFLGNAVIGEWCNLGADTNCSNLKNNYDTVKIWSIANSALETTGLQFCGLIMGDHSKCGINTMFNTGTVVGVSANIFGASFPDKYIPSFTWGGITEQTIYRFDKAVATANRMMQRRNQCLSEAEVAVLKTIYDHIVS